MYRFMTRHEEQRFASKKQAIDFYERGARECGGAESDRYYAYADAIAESKSPNEARYLFAGDVKTILEYDPAEDYLRIL